jgi:hypothetical protein
VPVSTNAGEPRKLADAFAGSPAYGVRALETSARALGGSTGTRFKALAGPLHGQAVLDAAARALAATGPKGALADLAVKPATFRVASQALGGSTGTRFKALAGPLHGQAVLDAARALAATGPKGALADLAAGQLVADHFAPPRGEQPLSHPPHDAHDHIGSNLDPLVLQLTLVLLAVWLIAEWATLIVERPDVADFMDKMLAGTIPVVGGAAWVWRKIPPRKGR